MGVDRVVPNTQSLTPNTSTGMTARLPKALFTHVA